MKEMELDSSSGTMENSRGIGWGKSLPVPSVQEIVRRDSNSVPERYIREHIDRPNDANFGAHSPSLPVINFSQLAVGDDEERRQLDLACKDWGFFQVCRN